MGRLNRRDFLKIITNTLIWLSGALGLGGLLRYLDYQVYPSPPQDFDLGSESNFPLGSRTVLPEVPAILLHTANGYSAISLTCTHLGCTVEQEVDGYACPCHGSRFGENGQVERGPAKDPLPSFRVEITDDGNLVLYVN